MAIPVYGASQIWRHLLETKIKESVGLGLLVVENSIGHVFVYGLMSTLQVLSSHRLQALRRLDAACQLLQISHV